MYHFIEKKKMRIMISKFLQITRTYSYSFVPLSTYIGVPIYLMEKENNNKENYKSIC